MHKTIFTIALLVISIFLIYKIQNFIEKNKPVPVNQDDQSHITTFQVVDDTQKDTEYRIVDGESINSELSTSTPSI